MQRAVVIQNKFVKANYIQKESNVIEHKGVVLNLKNTTLNYEDKEIALTQNDFKILRILFESVGKVVPMDRIIGCLWEEEDFVDENRITVNIMKLRRRLGEIGLDDYIEAQNNRGYIIN
ncbi:MAG: winged helix-turn-helix domain-containing protein [Aminipila sp.]